MAFWTDTGKGPVEPKRAYRWLLYFGQLSKPWIAKKVSKPGFSISEVKHTYLNHHFYYPGKVEWSTVTATLVDPGDPDVAQSMYNILRNSGYKVPGGEDAVPITVSKGAAVGQMNNVKIQQIQNVYSDDAAGTINSGQIRVVEEWQLYGAWIKDVKFGELDYGSDELVEITVELRYDYARLNSENAAGSFSGGDPSTPVTKQFV